MRVTVLIIVSSIAIFFSCQPEESHPQSGTVDLSNYIAIGNSLTAGYTNNGLYREGQLNSYPNIVAQQFSSIVEIDFKQPLMPQGNGSGYLKLISYTSGSFPAIELIEPDPLAYEKVDGPFDNLGIPGLRVKDIDLKEYGQRDLNRFFYRIVRSGNETSTSYLDLLADKNPTFFTSWLGNNDILGYALEGGAYGIDGHGPYGNAGLTDSMIFKNNYEKLLLSIVDNNTKGILFTIPDISLIPYFTLVNNDLFPGLSEKKVDELKELWSDYNALIEKHNELVEQNKDLSQEEKTALLREKIEFQVGKKNRFVIEDNSLPDLLTSENAPKIRHIKEGEIITIAGGQQIINLSEPAGIEKMLEDKFVLTLNEISTLKGFLHSYNNTIRSLARQFDLEIIDANALLYGFSEGKEIDGLFLSTEYMEGGIFSLDATHLTPRGNALIANTIINKINKSYDATIPEVSLSDFAAVITE